GVSVQQALNLNDPRPATPFPSAIALRCSSSTSPTDLATTVNATIPIVRAPPPSEPVPRFPPLRLVGHLPPISVASSICGRCPTTLSISGSRRRGTGRLLPALPRRGGYPVEALSGVSEEARP